MSLSLDREKEANTALHTRRRLSSKTYDAAAASVQHQMAPRRTLLPVLSLVVIFGLLGLLLVLGDRRVIAGSGLDNEPVSKLRSAVVVPTRDGVYEVPAGDADAAGISPAGQAGEEQDETAEGPSVAVPPASAVDLVTLEPTGASPDGVASVPRQQLAGFWHVAMVGEHWAGVVADQAKTLKESGILSELQQLQVVVSGGEGDELARAVVEDNLGRGQANVNITWAGPRIERWEYPTLKRLEQYCGGHPEALVFYMHDKGSRYSPDDPSMADTFRGAWEWRRFMEYFIVTRYKECVSTLTDQDDVAACGTNWMNLDFVGEPNIYVYGGNFWWGRCKYIRTLPSINVDEENRYGAEHWISLSPERDEKWKFADCWPMPSHDFYLPQTWARVRYRDRPFTCFTDPEAFHPPSYYMDEEQSRH